MDRNDFIEKVIGGFLGAVAIIATVAELILSGITPDGIAGAVKDIASTFVVIFILIAFINDHKKVKGLRGTIESKMAEIEKSYNPLIREAVASETSGINKKNKLEKVIRYEIAAETDVMFGKKSAVYAPFFDVAAEAPEKIEFYIRQMFFGLNENGVFDAQSIYNRIDTYMNKHQEIVKMQFLPDKSGGKIIVDFSLKYGKDVEMMKKIVDDMIFAYILVKKS